MDPQSGCPETPLLKNPFFPGLAVVMYLSSPPSPPPPPPWQLAPSPTAIFEPEGGWKGCWRSHWSPHALGRWPTRVWRWSTAFRYQSVVLVVYVHFIQKTFYLPLRVTPLVPTLWRPGAGGWASGWLLEGHTLPYNMCGAQTTLYRPLGGSQGR